MEIQAINTGTIYHSHNNVYSWNFLSLLRYRTQFGEGHNIEAFVAHEVLEEADIY